MGDEEESRRYTVPQASRLLGLSERSLRRRIQSGEIRAVREGAQWIVLLPSGAEHAARHGDPIPELPAAPRPSHDEPSLELIRLVRDLSARVESLSHENGRLTSENTQLRAHLAALVDTVSPFKARRALLARLLQRAKTALPTANTPLDGDSP